MEGFSNPGSFNLVLRELIEGHAPTVKRSSAKNSLQKFYSNYVAELTSALENVDIDEVNVLVQALLSAREDNRQIFVMGNGGSASTASHMINDLAKDHTNGRKKPFRVIGLNDNISWVTASANDYGYETIFVNQLKNLLQPHDVVIAISSSGNSANIIRAIEFANKKGALTFGVVGFGGGKLKETANFCIDIPSKKGDYGLMEDASLAINHVVSLFIRELDAA